jgi:hypothetical protein
MEISTTIPETIVPELLRLDHAAELCAALIDALRTGNQDLAQEARQKMQTQYGKRLLFASELQSQKEAGHDE